MIKQLIVGKALPWIAGATALVFAMMAAAIWFLMQERDALNHKAGELEERNASYAETIRQQSADYALLSAEIERRDDAVSQAIEDREAAERYARAQIEQLRQALATDECAVTDHPDVVTDSLRTGTNHQAQD